MILKGGLKPFGFALTLCLIFTLLSTTSFAWAQTTHTTASVPSSDKQDEAAASSMQKVGDLRIAGGTEGGDYSYNSSTHTISILRATPLTISGTSTVDKIVVTSGVSAAITLDTVALDIDGTPLDIANASLNLTLVGANRLKHVNSAGTAIHVPSTARLGIKGSGSLDAIGGPTGAAIGSAFSENAGAITITGGIIHATGGSFGAGIGGGLVGGGGSVMILGGSVYASSADPQAAGIGYGYQGLSKGGSFSTSEEGAPGNAFIDASAITDQSHADNWSGVIFQGAAGAVYGNPTLIVDVSLGAAKTLTIPKGNTLTIGSGTSLKNAGTIQNDGTIVNQGKLEKEGLGTYEGLGTIISDSQTSISFSENPVPFEGSFSITAQVIQAAPSAWESQAPSGVINFSCKGTALGTSVLTNTSSGTGATLTMSAGEWKKSSLTIGDNIIQANFGGSAGLAASSDAVSLTVGKGKMSAPQVSGVAESVAGKNDGRIEKLTGAMQYATSKDGQYLSVTDQKMTFAPGTYWVRFAEDTTHYPSDSTPVVIDAGAKSALGLSVTLDDWVYGATPSQPVLSGNAGNGKVSYTYKPLSAPDDDFSPNLPIAAGTYTVLASVSETPLYKAGEAQATFTIAKATPKAPTLGSQAETYPGAKDGHITGLDPSAEYEYASEKAGSYTQIKTGDPLTAGTYYVRIKGDANHNPSDPTEVVILQGTTPPVPPAPSTPSTPDPGYRQQTIVSKPDVDTSSVAKVSGYLSTNAWLEIVPLRKGNSSYDILNHLAVAEGQDTVAAWNVILHGNYKGKLDLCFEVGSAYNGQVLSIYHEKSHGATETFSATAAHGCISFEVASLSPYLIAKQTSQSTLPVIPPTSEGGFSPDKTTASPEMFVPGHAPSTSPLSDHRTPVHLAKTGDNPASFTGFLLAVLASGAVLVVCVVRILRRRLNMRR